MPRLAFWTSSFLLVFCSFLSASAAPNHYKIKATIDPNLRVLHANATVEFAAPADAKTLRLLLNKSLKVTSVECAECKGFRFASAEPPGYRYMRSGAPLYIKLKRPARTGEWITLHIVYEGPLASPDWPVNMIGPDWTELAQYIGWYPFMPELRSFTYDLDIATGAEYTVTGAGIVERRSAGRWHISQQMATWDIVVIAAKKLSTISLPKRPSVLVQHGATSERADAEQVMNLIETAVNRYTVWFGSFGGGHLTLVITDRPQGGAYVRPGLVSLPRLGPMSDERMRRLTNRVGHETAHLWWAGAPTTTWEDWLNESFAEYSSWLLVKQQYGREEFEKLIAKAQEDTGGKPAVWHIDRNSDDAYVVLYEKGALLLNDLAAEIGEEAFLELLTQFAHTQSRTTSKFLDQLEKMTTRATREWFEEALKH